MSYVYTWQGKTLIAIDPVEIMYIVAEDVYARLYLTEQRTYLLRNTLSAVLAKLPPELFVRTHRTYAVSVNHIRCLERESIIIGSNIIPISKPYLNSILSRLTILD